MVTNEITRVTNTIAAQVRLHGTFKEGSLYRNWIALFPRESAPRPGFRLFHESGMAAPFRPRRQVEQCKRCLGFHAAHGCSRAPAYWNCGSTMHSATECKAPAKYRNCGGPHRSDCRNCLTRPTRTGPVTKEQLVTIRQYGQREYAAVARAKVAARKTEYVGKAASADVPMEEGIGFGGLNSEEV